MVSCHFYPLFSFNPEKNVLTSTLFHCGLKMSARLQGDVGCLPWLAMESVESYLG